MLNYDIVPLAPPPPGVTPNFVNPPSILWQFIAVSMVSIIIAVVFLSVHLYTKLVLLKNAGIEEVFLVIAFLMALAEVCLGMVDGRYGSGIHSWDVPLSHISSFLLIKFICMILYLTSLLFVKLAILTLFYRIATLRAYTWFIIGVACVTIAAYLGSLISLLVQCTPVTNQWAINHPHCASLDYSRRWVLAQGSINITIEFVMLLFPIRLVWDVMLPVRQKIGIVLIMMSGSLVGFLSIARLISLIPVLENPEDATYSDKKVGIISVLECQVAVICACLPALKPFFKRHLTGVATFIHDMANRITKVFSPYAQFSRNDKNVVTEVDTKGRIKMVNINMKPVTIESLEATSSEASLRPLPKTWKGYLGRDPSC